ncbi:hypothetical protein NBRC116583_24570 [Arenicella sp. 4NH20-0111]
MALVATFTFVLPTMEAKLGTAMSVKVANIVIAIIASRSEKPDSTAKS